MMILEHYEKLTPLVEFNIKVMNLQLSDKTVAEEY